MIKFSAADVIDNPVRRIFRNFRITASDDMDLFRDDLEHRGCEYFIGMEDAVMRI